MVVSESERPIFFYFFHDTHHNFANITGSSRLSKHYSLQLSETERNGHMIFMSLNLFVGNLFRLLVFRVVLSPSSLAKPINRIIAVDELIKIIG